MTTVANIPGTRLLNHISSYPLVSDTYNQAASYYTWVKSSSTYVAAPLNLAETGLKKAVETSQPVLQKFNGQLNMVEDIACAKLAQMETRYPVVLKPTRELRDDGKEYYETNIQPIVQRAVSPITNTCTSVKEYGTKTVDTLAHSTLAKKGYSLLEQVVDTADIYTDKYLEEETDGEKTQAESKDLYGKTLNLTTKCKRRLYSKAMKGLQNMKVRSNESLQKLTFTVDLMEYAKTQMTGVKGRFDDIYDEISHEYAEESKKEIEEDKKDGESRVLNKTRALANTVRLSVLTASTMFYRHLSEENQIRLVKAKQYSEEFYAQLVKSKTLTDLNDVFFTNSRRTLKYVQDTLNTTLMFIKEQWEQRMNKQETPAIGGPDKTEEKEEPVSSNDESDE